MANRPVENTPPKTGYNTEVNNSLAWKVTRNWQVTVRNSLLTLSWLWHLSAALIYDSLHLEFPHPGLPLQRTTDQQSHTPSFLLLTVLCVQRATILFLRGQRLSQQLEAAEPCLQINWLGSSKSKASKSYSFFRGNTKWGCPMVKREEAREQEVVT